MNDKETKITFADRTTCDDNPKEFVRQFLQNKCINDDYINDILKYGLVDSCVNVLVNEGLASDEIEIIQNALKKIDLDLCDCSSTTETNISIKHQEADYLKENFNKILSLGLREIVSKKPFDPIEYLGHWLLHYRNCEEEEKKRNEFEAELLEERLRWQEANKIECPMFQERIERCRYSSEEEEENKYVEEYLGK